MQNDIEHLKELAYRAGELALKLYGKVAVEYKSDESVVTDADREIELLIRDEIKKRYPGHSFLGEEYGLQGDERNPIWACDPIDGTTNYIMNIPIWGVSLGLIEEGHPQMGVFYLPVLNEMFWAVRGEGAYCNGELLISVDGSKLHQEDTLCLTSNALKVLNTESAECRIRCLGSIAAELAYVGSGRMTGAIGLYEGIVDMAATLCVCFATGCEFRHLRNGENVNIADLLRIKRTEEPFVVAPPKRMELLLSTFHQARALT